MLEGILSRDALLRTKFPEFRQEVDRGAVDALVEETLRPRSGTPIEKLELAVPGHQFGGIGFDSGRLDGKRVEENENAF